MNNLLKLLQPIGYKSKLKLYCKVENGVIVKKYSETFVNVKNK